MRFTKAFWISIAWISAALIFNVGILVTMGPQKALEFLTGYLIELSLSIDNLVIFFFIFSCFDVDIKQQARILTWGVLGAQLMRAVFILLGITLLKTLSWVIYGFGVLLVFSGFKLFFNKNYQIELDQNPFIRILKGSGLSKFLIVLLAVEGADLIFAVDSIPAVLSVTKDPMIVYTSNIFAIMGLRSLYFFLSPVIDKFPYLHYTLGTILIFVGFKMLVEPFWHMPIVYAFGFIVVVLGVSNIYTSRKRREAH